MGPAGGAVHGLAAGDPRVMLARLPAIVAVWPPRAAPAVALHADQVSRQAGRQTGLVL